MNDPENYSDLSSFFAEVDKDFESSDFLNATMRSVRRDEKRRRLVLSGFGLCGGLIAGSQIPLLFDTLMRLELDFGVQDSISLLGTDLSSIMLWLLIGAIGLATLALTTGETT